MRTKSPPIAHGARNMTSRLPLNSLTTNAPHTAPMGEQTPSTPETWPRCGDGTWSGSSAASAASSALKNNSAIHHPASTTGTLGASATIRMPREPPARPMSIQGRRMPSFDVVRSLIRPKNGLPTIATMAPPAHTRARLAGACWIPTSESTFKANVTSRGARNSREVLMYASVYSEMKPHPTRWTEGAEVSNAATTAVRSDNPSGPAARARPRRILGTGGEGRREHQHHDDACCHPPEGPGPPGEAEKSPVKHGACHWPPRGWLHARRRRGPEQQRRISLLCTQSSPLPSCDRTRDRPEAQGTAAGPADGRCHCRSPGGVRFDIFRETGPPMSSVPLPGRHCKCR